jgi:hypothetical protein
MKGIQISSEREGGSITHPSSTELEVDFLSYIVISAHEQSGE